MKAYAITDIGKKRSFNQDYAWMTTDEIGKLPNLFIVADGMGGHRGGGYASRLAVETILEQIRQSQADSPAEILVDAIRHANECIRQTAAEDEQLSGMGTTVVAATCADRQLQVANVGDSRLYIADDVGIRQITEDHSLVQEMVRMGEISQEEARNHPDKNIITRALGAEKTVDVDFFDLKLEPGNVVLMCSDGLSNMVEDDRIGEIISDTDRDLQERGQALISEANRNGGKDNIAIVLIEPFANEVEEC